MLHLTPLCRPRLKTLMLFDANNSKSSEADTVDCSVFSLAQRHATAEVSNDEAEIDIKMAEIRSGEEYDAGRQCRATGAQISKRKLPRSQLSATEGRVLSDFLATWINILTFFI